MRAIVIALAGLGVLSVGLPLGAQGRFSLDARAGIALPTKDIADGQLNTGFGFEGAVAYRVLPSLSAYVGWDWHGFSADESFAGADLDFTETGYAYGLQFERTYAGESASGLAYRLRFGGTYNRLEIEDSGGTLVADTDHGAGVEGGFGIVLPFNERWSVSPEIRYRALSRDVTVGDDTTEVRLRYFSLDLGVTFRP